MSKKRSLLFSVVRGALAIFIALAVATLLIFVCAEGETLAEAAERTRGVIRQVSAALDDGHDVLLVAHAHILRILTTQWLGVDPHDGRLLRLDTAHYCVLGQYHGDHVIVHWNC